MHAMRSLVNRRGFFELEAALINTDLKRSREQILEACRSVQLSDHWPVFLIDSSQPPTAKENGIVSSIQLGNRRIYQYWGISIFGDMYFCETFQEADLLPSASEGTPGAGPVPIGSHKDRLNYDLRFRRVAEALLFCHRFYANALKLDPKILIQVRVRHGGLTECELSASDYRTWGKRLQFRPGEATENEAKKEEAVYLEEIRERLPQLVEVFPKTC